MTEYLRNRAHSLAHLHQDRPTLGACITGAAMPLGDLQQVQRVQYPHRKILKEDCQQRTVIFPSAELVRIELGLELCDRFLGLDIAKRFPLDHHLAQAQTGSRRAILPGAVSRLEFLEQKQGLHRHARQRYGARKYEEDEVRLKHPSDPLFVALLAHRDEAKCIAGNVLQRAEQADDKCAAARAKDLTASAPSV